MVEKWDEEMVTGMGFRPPEVTFCNHCKIFECKVEGEGKNRRGYQYSEGFRFTRAIPIEDCNLRHDKEEAE